MPALTIPAVLLKIQLNAYSWNNLSPRKKLSVIDALRDFRPPDNSLLATLGMKAGGAGPERVVCTSPKSEDDAAFISCVVPTINTPS
ncbi:uncharacterized protein RAG0_13917 [Rhynchosporium agropyri]|uniref:Uncharacterized protein n=1 Tax=Rhynchosporium agropyri TaxID=914238 RepID=A0A1E1LES8_9HELO|nr:uncharacterized protein RAG0_13917 [Rhynchosporium agropyri]